ncbi:hypothetical protein RMCBS344292_12687 [Rhizopus microsporus]|nr:hypothetical protein RMCBS344292_12687 [Rhizopus microsporus]
MTSKLDRALDDVIQERKKGRNTHPGPRRQTSHIRKPKRSEPPVRSFIRTIKIQGSSQRRGNGPRDVNSPWAHDKFQDDVSSSLVMSRLGSRTSNVSRGGGVEITIDNLHYNVTENDVLELFSTVGQVEKARLFYDRSGRSTGQAKVRYASNSDAQKAIEKFNNVELDGQPMKIEVSQPPAHRSSRSGNNSSRRHDRGRPGRTSKERTSKDKTEKTAEELDKEMDSYMNQNEEMALD